jgi:polysaccharide biosynthesis protein VpsP
LDTNNYSSIQNNAFSRALAFLAIPVFLGLIYVATNWGMADVYYRPAMNQLRNWEQGKIELENKDWDKLRISLSKSLELDPNNPKIHEILALAIEGRFSNVVPKDAEANVFRKLALEHYRKSVLLRPTWPYVWNKLTVVKYRLGQIDDEFYEALHNAERLGPWEPVIQRMVLEVGLINWLVFSKPERTFVLETISNALEKEPQKALEIIKKHNLLDIICLLNKDKPRVTDYCKKHQKK